MPIQQMLLGAGSAVATKTYVDDVFSTYVYKGTGSTQNINNGINLSGEGGLIWTKYRNQSWNHALIDSERGINSVLTSNNNNAADIVNTSPGSMSSFNNNGYSLAGDPAGWVNYNGEKLASWTFRKSPGFFDVVTYTGNGSNQNISHSLGCVPGCIMVKRLDTAKDWCVYHRATGKSQHLELNNTDVAYTSTTRWNQTDPTASVFTVGDSSQTNANAATYVAYVFAGGESTAATARSVEFDGSDDYLSLGASNDFDMGTGDFTIECWINRDDTSNNSVWTLGSYQNGMELYIYDDDSIRVYGNNGSGASWLIQSSANALSPGTWHHIAVVRHSGTLKLFQNGTLLGSTAHSSAMPNNSEVSDFFIGVEVSTDGSIPGTNPYFDGEISNFRVVKGTAVYTSSFRPPYEPLTNITNTKLLCCNNSSVTGSTVTPGTITANSSPTASTDSPFDDPAGFSFGDAEDQNVIKCGSYVGNGSTDGPEINLGFEPQWLMVKRTDTADKWPIYDSMRGIVTGGNDARLYANETNSEYTSNDYFDLTPTGFKITKNSGEVNGNGGTYIYMCIRRSDGYVGKPPELGTDVFNMVMGTSNSDVPAYVSGFVTDFAFNRSPTATEDWWTQSRLTGDKYLRANTNGSQGTSTPNKWDYNNGWYAATSDQSAYQSWMFKRGAGMDVVAYEGNGVAGRQVPHSLSKTPEMMWVKNKDSSEDWFVYHSGLYDGYGPTNSPQNYRIRLNLNSGVTDTSTAWNDTAPTATHFTLGNADNVNKDNEDHIAMLFSSVTGISKIGTYIGNHAARTITTEFQPRFLIIKGMGSGSDNEWVVFDTTRGWASGVDNYLVLNDNSAQTNALDAGQPTSTGFTLTGGDDYRRWNDYGVRYIYYCHA